MKAIIDFFRSEKGDDVTFGFGLGMLLSAFAFSSPFWFFIAIAFIVVAWMTKVARKHLPEDNHERND